VKQGRLNLLLRNVTAALRQGLCRLSSDPAAPYQLDLVTDAKNSIVYVTDPNAALIERRGVQGLGDVAKRLYLRGRDNFYLGSTRLLRINPADDPSLYADYDFEQRDASWYLEESPRFRLLWRSAPPVERHEALHTVEDYLLDENENNPARMTSDDVPAGVDPTRLPALPEALAGS
jgi:hypothetical protein